jgi:hypothetical protein
LKRQCNLTKKHTGVKLGVATEPRAAYKNCSAKKILIALGVIHFASFRSLLPKNYASSDLMPQFFAKLLFIGSSRDHRIDAGR